MFFAIQAQSSSLPAILEQAEKGSTVAQRRQLAEPVALTPEDYFEEFASYGAAQSATTARPWLSNDILVEINRDGLVSHLRIWGWGEARDAQWLQYIREEREHHRDMVAWYAAQAKRAQEDGFPAPIAHR